MGTDREDRMVQVEKVSRMDRASWVYGGRRNVKQCVAGQYMGHQMFASFVNLQILNGTMHLYRL